MKAIVVYTSKYGSTEKYAKWIAEALACPAKKLKDVSKQELAACDTLIYGGGVYASGIAGLKKFLAQIAPAPNKRFVLFIVGLTNPAQTGTYLEIAKQNLPPEWKSRFEIFALRGDQFFSKMGGMHKLMMRMPKSMAEKKPEEQRTEEDKQFIENFGKDIVFSSKEQIEPLIRSLQKENL